MSCEHIAGAATCQSVIDRRALRPMLHDRAGKVIGLLGSCMWCTACMSHEATGDVHAVCKEHYIQYTCTQLIFVQL